MVGAAPFVFSVFCHADPVASSSATSTSSSSSARFVLRIAVASFVENAFDARLACLHLSFSVSECYVWQCALCVQLILCHFDLQRQHEFSGHVACCECKVLSCISVQVRFACLLLILAPPHPSLLLPSSFPPSCSFPSCVPCDPLHLLLSILLFCLHILFGCAHVP